MKNRTQLPAIRLAIAADYESRSVTEAFPIERKHASSLVITAGRAGSAAGTISLYRSKQMNRSFKKWPNPLGRISVPPAFTG